eukprot:364943-Chlamydomonas_euryale.AAC.21
MLKNRGPTGFARMSPHKHTRLMLPAIRLWLMLRTRASVRVTVQEEDVIGHRKTTPVDTLTRLVAAFCLIFAPFLTTAIAPAPHGLWDGCE